MAEQLTFNTTAKLKANSLTMYNSGVTESVAERFSKVDEELKLVRDRIFKIYDHLDEVWNGPASEAYLTQFNRLWNQMNDFSSAFLHTSLCCHVFSERLAASHKIMSTEILMKEKAR